jgi:hypothetical protein
VGWPASAARDPPVGEGGDRQPDVRYEQRADDGLDRSRMRDPVSNLRMLNHVNDARWRHISKAMLVYSLVYSYLDVLTMDVR